MFLSFWQNYEQLLQIATVNIASGRPPSVQGCLVPMRQRVQIVSGVIAPRCCLFRGVPSRSLNQRAPLFNPLAIVLD